MTDENEVAPELAETLLEAIGHHQQGKLDVAEKLYNTVLHQAPGHPDALHFLGVLLHQSGKSQMAIESIQASIAVCPSHPDVHVNLGNILKDLGKPNEAETCYRQAIALAPQHVNARHNLAILLSEQDQLDEAVTAYRAVIHLQPDHDIARYHLGMILYKLGHVEQAVVSFQEWLELDPDNPRAQHMLAAWTGKDQPARAQDDYIREVFDGFAESFDEQLGKLGYRAPQLLAEVIQRGMKAPEARLDVLDAGCGTGLCGPYLRPYSRRLAGVDISQGMLEKAHGLDVYDELITAELTILCEGSAESYDLIVAADTLCYFGDLKKILKAMVVALRPGGHVAFTLEQATPDQNNSGFQLNTHGRYSHTENYARHVLKETGLGIRSSGHAILRMENNVPVHGLVVLANIPDA